MKFLVVSTIIGLILMSVNPSKIDGYYTAGVVEFSPELDKNQSPADTIRKTQNAYLNFIDEAQEKDVDILVFPEATFNYYFAFDNRQFLLDNALELPDPKLMVAPVDVSTQYSDVLVKFSQNIRKNQIYTLINVVEKENCKNSIKCSDSGWNLYNTNVVFDRNGTIISRYRKFNLFLEPNMNVTDAPEISTFMTDFGVEFGHFICFDILFKSPTLDLIQRNIRNILYPSMWFSEVPFLTATQIHQSWSYENDVNLISAGGSNPLAGSTGSGIFAGRNGPQVVLMSPKPVRKLLVAQIWPEHSPTSNLENEKPISPTIRYTPMEMDSVHIVNHTISYSVGLIDGTKRICRENICCNFRVKYNQLDIPNGMVGYSYRMAIGSNTRQYGDRDIAGELFCAIVSCTENKQESCASRFKSSANLVPSVEFIDISIKITIQQRDSINCKILPNSLDFSVLPLNTSYFKTTSTSDDEEFSYEIETKRSIDNLLTFGIYGRNFSQDIRVEGKILANNLDNLLSFAISSQISVFLFMIITGWLAFSYV